LLVDGPFLGEPKSVTVDLFFLGLAGILRNC